MDNKGQVMIYPQDGAPVAKVMTADGRKHKWVNAGTRWVVLKQGEDPRNLTPLENEGLFDPKLRGMSTTASTKSTGVKRGAEDDLQELEDQIIG